jgi:nicotinate-nucleotide adenylyltransferase
MRIAIMGGTFNPVHYGHLFLAEEVKNRLGYDKILFIPAFKPAHKSVTSSVPANHRYVMVKLATTGYPQFAIDDCELRRGGISYTIETVTEIREKYKQNTEIGLIIGDDLLTQFHLWKNAEELAAQTELIVARRIYKTRRKFRYPHAYLDNKILPISASEIRQRIASHHTIRFLLPDKVYDYIREHALYT